MGTILFLNPSPARSITKRRIRSLLIVRARPPLAKDSSVCACPLRRDESGLDSPFAPAPVGRIRLPKLLQGLTPRLACPGAPGSPLRLIPNEADLLLQVQSPRRIADLLRNLDLLEQIQTFPFVKEQLASTPGRRGRQLLAYVEKQLGGKWYDLLDPPRRWWSGPSASSSATTRRPLVIQGTDEKLVEKFLDLAATIATDELARQESKEEVKKIDYDGIPATGSASLSFAARAGLGHHFQQPTKKRWLALSISIGARKKKSLATHPARCPGGPVGSPRRR